MPDIKILSRTRPDSLLARAHTLSLCGAILLALAGTRPAPAQTGATAKDSSAQKPASAQSQDGAAKPAGAAVRERRVGDGGSSPAGKAEAKVEPEAKVNTGGKVEPEAKVDGEAMPVYEDMPSGEDTGLAELREKIEGAQTDAERSRLRRALAERLAERGLKGEAVTELRALLAEERTDPANFYNVGNALARLNESNAAVEAYSKAIAQRRGNYPRAQHNLGVVLTRLGRWEEARVALAAAVRLEGGFYPEASYNLGRLHAMRGEAGLAIDEWARALKREPEHADTAVALARALAEDGDPDQGLAVLDAASTRLGRRGVPVPRAIEVTRGEIVAALNLYKESERAEGKPARVEKTSAGGPRESSGPSLLRAHPVDQQTYDLLRRARTARESNRHEEAVALYRRVIDRRGGYFAPANIELGYSLTNLRRDAEAIEALRQVVSKDNSRYPAAFYHLGRLYEQTGDLARSRDSFARAVAIFGDTNPQPLLDLCRLREKTGDLRGAVETMETYVRLTARLGGTPEWAHARLAELQKKAAPPASQDK